MPTLERLQRRLERGDRLCYADITAAFGIVERQARRLIDRLRERGVPVREERVDRAKWFFLAPEDQPTEVPPLSLSPDEALALAVALRAGAAVLRSTPLQAPLAAATRGLVDHLAPHVALFDLEEQDDRWYFDAVALNRIDPKVFGVLLQALEQQQSVFVDYQKPNHPIDAGRKLDPHCFAVVGNVVMMAAYCHRAGAMRDFSLSRIRRVVLADPATDVKPYFYRRPDFSPRRHFDRFGAMAGSDRCVLRLLVEPDRVPFFEDRDYHHSQDLEDYEPDGRAVVSYDAVGFEEMKSFAQGWGVGVTVLEPPEMAARIRAEAAELVARYDALDVNGHHASGLPPPLANLPAE